MPATFTVKLDGRFVKEARGRIEKFSFDVGVLDDKPHKLQLTKGKAVSRLKSKGAGASQLTEFLFTTLAGGPARRIGSKASDKTIAQVSEEARRKTGINFYTRPWKSKQNRDLVRFIQSFMRLITQGGKLTEKKRLENALQAVVRNPIVRGDYGGNSHGTAKSKGFSRLLINTGQLFRAITARVRISKGSNV